MFKSFKTKQEAKNECIAKGGFLYSWDGMFYSIPAASIRVAESFGMVLESWE